MNINDIIKLSHIKRWHRMRVRREQNLAEHSFNVTAIAYNIYQDIVPEELKNDKDTNSLLVYSLFHDAGEMYTGDIASPFKDLARKFLKNSNYDGEDFFESIEDKLFPEGKEYKDMVKDTPLKIISKLADILDAIAFTKLEIFGAEGEMVLIKLVGNFTKYIEQGEHDYPLIPWRKSYNYMNELIMNNSCVESKQ